MYRSTRKLLKIIIKGCLRDAFWCIYGKTLQNPPIPRNTKTITYICKGNICRSPFAQHISELICKHKGKHEYRFLSAGIKVKSPTPPPSAAVQAAAKFGIAMENHRSNPFDLQKMRQSGMAIAMETWQFHALKKKYPQYIDRIFLLPLLENVNKPYGKGLNAYNIADPYGKSVDVFIECYTRMEACISSLITTLNRNTLTSITGKP